MCVCVCEHLNLQAELLERRALDLGELVAVQQTRPQAVIQVVAFTWRHPTHTGKRSIILFTQHWKLTQKYIHTEPC